MEKIRSLVVVLIQPSRYDDDGYVIRYFRGVLPSNTLACLRGLTLDFAERWKSERNISVTVEAFDEMVERIPFHALARQNRGSTKVVASLVGVQSNQFARASDLAKKLSGLGIKTLIGGFHVSGILSMFGEPTPEIRELMDAGVTIVHGEAENRWESILADVLDGVEKPLYLMEEFPVISDAPFPQPAARYMKKFALPFMGTVDCSRGCPFNCSFCTVVNVQGHRMRHRAAENVLSSIRENYSRGVSEYFFTDDNFARNPEWERILDGIIVMRERDGMNITIMMQVDTRSHTIQNFTEKAARAGCSQIFIGMESVNPKNLEAANKKQNHAEDYAAFIDAWHAAGVVTHVGYIIGFPFDTPESVREDIHTLMEEIRVDQASFFMLTPLPGSVDHREMVRSGGRLDPDLNKYDSFHAVMDHPRMTSTEWTAAYNEAWGQFYSFANMRNILMRTGKRAYWGVFKNFMWYRNSLLEPRHPMVAGFVRRKHRHDVRPGIPVEGFWKFNLQRMTEMYRAFLKRVDLFWELQELWLLTRRPDDPTFRFAAEFTASVTSAKERLAAIDIRIPYAKWREEIVISLGTLRDSMMRQCRCAGISRKFRRRLEKLIVEMSAQIERLTPGEPYARSVISITSYLSRTAQTIEEFSLAQVGRRRKVTAYWRLTRKRIKEGKVFRFLFSLPKLAVNGIKDLRMSLFFLFNVLNGGFARHK